MTWLQRFSTRWPLLPGRRDRRFPSSILLLIPSFLLASVRAADLEREPIRYSQAPANNPIARLEQRLA
jgi:hypothetical protein